MGRADDERVLVYNPTSGSEDHTDRVPDLARGYGFEVRETKREGDSRRLAREAANAGIGLVAAGGGDGTVNEVVNGIRDADGLSKTTLAVVPTGTGNNFASNLGIDDLETAFGLLETGERRRIDLGIANDRVFVNSCVGGVTAEASAATTSEDKRNLGVLAYVMRTLESVTNFDPLRLRVTFEPEFADTGADERWTGEAIFVLVGNCRHFGTVRRSQADVEDGLFEVTVVERSPPTDLVGKAVLEGLFNRENTHVLRRRTPSMTVESVDDDPVEYSLDGEILETERLTLETVPSALEVVVGERYRPDPD
ncbi:diacylglycerol/lipid kinase family protein [Natrialbaceae archaeon A-gly3]